MTEKISATIEIAAAPEHVWAVLADLASYPQWHPVFREASGLVAAGSRMTLTSAHPDTGRIMTAKVKVLTAEPSAELRWVSSVLGMMRSERSFTLSPVRGGTRLVQAGSYRGLFARFPAKTIGRIEGGFEAINQAIKQRAEDLLQAPGQEQGNRAPEDGHDRALPSRRPGAHHAGHPPPRRDQRQHRAHLAPDQGGVVAVQPGPSGAA